jgi:hypothetical protein
VRILNASKVVLQRWGDAYVLFGKATHDYFRVLEMAMTQAKTWREFRCLLSNDDFEELPFWYGNYGGYIYQEDGRRYFDYNDSDGKFYEDPDVWLIDADDAFEYGDVPGVSDGDFPPWTYTMLDKSDLPQEFFERFAEGVDSALNGSWFVIPKEHIGEAIEYLQSEGYELYINRVFDFAIEPERL